MEEEDHQTTTDTEPSKDQQETSVPWADKRDEIIAENKRTIQQLQAHFRESVEALRLELANYVHQSTELQQAMFLRILQLDAKIREREDLLLTHSPTRQKPAGKKKGPGAKQKEPAKPNQLPPPA
jgi:t-SNARE complex subunit (syntaxin)